MSEQLTENLPRLLIGLLGMGGLGIISIFLKKSWNQFVRLYKDDLVKCQSRETGHLESVARLKETISFQNERSAYREDRMEELLDELGAMRSEYERLENTIRPATRPHRRSSSPPR